MRIFLLYSFHSLLTLLSVSFSPQRVQSIHFFSPSVSTIFLQRSHSSPPLHCWFLADGFFACLVLHLRICLCFARVSASSWCDDAFPYRECTHEIQYKIRQDKTSCWHFLVPTTLLDLIGSSIEPAIHRPI